MRDTELIFQLGVMVFGFSCLPLVRRAARDLRSATRVPAHTVGSLAVILGVAGMALLVLELGNAESALALLLIKTALVLLLAFTQSVFRSGTWWATAVLVGGALSSAGSLALDFLSLESGVVPVGSPAHLVGQLVTAAAALWLGVECALAYSRHRRRLRVGLTDPVTANRFGLAAMASMLLVTICAVTAAEGLAWIPVGPSQSLRGLLHGGMGILLLLVFAPPRVFTDWIVERAAHP